MSASGSYYQTSGFACPRKSDCLLSNCKGTHLLAHVHDLRTRTVRRDKCIRANRRRKSKLHSVIDRAAKQTPPNRSPVVSAIQTSSRTPLSISRTCPATPCYWLLSIPAKDASGSTTETWTPDFVSYKLMLQGRIATPFVSRLSLPDHVRTASPRIRHSDMSLLVFSFMVALTSIAVSTRNPALARRSRGALDALPRTRC